MNVCRVKDCGRSAVAHGLCSTHYMRQRRGSKKPLDAPITGLEPRGIIPGPLHVPIQVADYLAERAKREGVTVYAAAVTALTRDYARHLVLLSSAAKSSKKVAKKKRKK